MTLLVFICNQPEKLEEILEGFLEVGLTGATVIDTVGMGQILSSEVPIFAGFRSLFRGASTVNKTIFSVVKEPGKIREALDIIDEIFGGLDQPGSGIVFTIPIDNVRGLAPEFD
jgi:nitrogen regulatory protein PII